MMILSESEFIDKGQNALLNGRLMAKLRHESSSNSLLAGYDLSSRWAVRMSAMRSAESSKSGQAVEFATYRDESSIQSHNTADSGGCQEEPKSDGTTDESLPPLNDAILHDEFDFDSLCQRIFSSKTTDSLQKNGTAIDQKNTAGLTELVNDASSNEKILDYINTQQHQIDTLRLKLQAKNRKQKLCNTFQHTKSNVSSSAVAPDCQKCISADSCQSPSYPNYQYETDASQPVYVYWPPENEPQGTDFSMRPETPADSMNYQFGNSCNYDQCQIQNPESFISEPQLSVQLKGQMVTDYPSYKHKIPHLGRPILPSKDRRTNVKASSWIL
eukprot:GHVH01001232.1.p1 GENE.GHVH01001232.1~~GHVH01001232.1.p1  ORF type:complete len:329 (-),score=43.43 GHVH01001232.1:100-1086(-)